MHAVTNLSEPQEKSPDILLAEERLAEAIRTSEDIAGKIDKLRMVQGKLNEQLGGLDMAWERRKFCEANLDGYFAWARGEGKLPSSKPLDSLENDARIQLIVLDHVGMRLLALDSAAKLSASEELENQARILQLRSQEENLRAARALDTVREAIGEDASIAVDNGRSQQLEEAADRLVEQAARLRRESEEQLKRLNEKMNTRGGL